MRKLYALFRFLIRFILPNQCLICGKLLADKNGFCPTCFAQIHFLSEQVCPSCSKPYTFPVDPNKELLCPQCILKKTLYIKNARGIYLFRLFQKGNFTFQAWR